MDPNKLNPFTLTLEQQIFQLVKNCEQCDKVCLSQYNVTSSQSYTLLSLPHEGSLSMIELSEALGVTCSTMTRIVDPLVKKKLIQRRSDDVDRRIVRVSLTDQGQELRLSLEKEFQYFFKNVSAKIPAEDLQVILDSLGKVNVAFKEAFENYQANLYR